MKQSVEHFYKYQGTGNDFILADNRQGHWDHLTRDQIASLCHRRFGVGADGLILLNSHPDFDFEMKNYNADGGQSSMCGNGARALVQFAYDLGLKKEHYRFAANDGPHEARLKDGLVCIKMVDVKKITPTPVGTLLDTGSPHLVVQKMDLDQIDVVSEGRALRNSPRFQPDGVNVNFIESRGTQVRIRTFERGVEDETLSCGTGAIASALVANSKLGPQQVQLQAPGGMLEVTFHRRSEQWVEDIWLNGPAVAVFQGTWIRPSAD